MKIALPQNGQEINQHFGRSKSFVIASLEGNRIVDKKEVSVEALQHNHEGLAELFEREGVSMVIAGGIGEHALKALQSKGFQVIRGAHGILDDVLKLYMDGTLQDEKTVCSHGEGHH